MFEPKPTTRPRDAERNGAQAQYLRDKRAACTPEQAALEKARAMAERRKAKAERRAFLRDARLLAQDRRDEAHYRHVVEHLGRTHSNQKLAWIYARASHYSNSDTDSIPAQIARLKLRFERDWEGLGYKLAPVQQDLVTSAYKVKFQDRTAGAAIFRDMQPGDVILVDKFDRAFRSLTDAVLTLEDLERREVHVDIANLGMTSKQPWYKIVVAILGAIAEMESKAKSERIKECFQRRREAGADTSPVMPYGIKLERRAKYSHGSKPLAFRVWDTWVRSIMNAICVKADKEGWDLALVRDWLNKEVLKNTPIPKKTLRLKYPLTNSMVLHLYWWEKMFRMAQITDVRETRDFIKKYGQLPKNWEKLQSIGWIELP